MNINLIELSACGKSAATGFLMPKGSHELQADVQLIKGHQSNNLKTKKHNKHHKNKQNKEPLWEEHLSIVRPPS